MVNVRHETKTHPLQLSFSAMDQVHSSRRGLSGRYSGDIRHILTCFEHEFNNAFVVTPYSTLRCTARDRVRVETFLKEFSVMLDPRPLRVIRCGSAWWDLRGSDSNAFKMWEYFRVAMTTYRSVCGALGCGDGVTAGYMTRLYIQTIGARQVWSSRSPLQTSANPRARTSL